MSDVGVIQNETNANVNDAIEAIKGQKDQKVDDRCQQNQLRLQKKHVFFLVLLFVIIGTFDRLLDFLSQADGFFMSAQYPDCEVRMSEIHKLGDGMCNGGVYNSFQCNFDGGDCLNFNMAFPHCKSLNAYEVGDGTCQEKHNTKECGFDAGDCCLISKDDIYLGDGQCHGGKYNTEACAYDQGDCDQFRYDNPSCSDSIFRTINRADGTPMKLGDGICDFVLEYMTVECNYEYGDCSECRVPDSSRLGNGICDGDLYNTEACRFDLGDCKN